MFAEELPLVAVALPSNSLATFKLQTQARPLFDVPLSLLKLAKTASPLK